MKVKIFTYSNGGGTYPDITKAQDDINEFLDTLIQDQIIDIKQSSTSGITNINLLLGI